MSNMVVNDHTDIQSNKKTTIIGRIPKVICDVPWEKGYIHFDLIYRVSHIKL